MIAKLAATASLGLMLAACVPPPPPAAPPPPAPAPAAAAVPAPPLPSGPHFVNPHKLSCEALLASSDDDRAAASMFLLGYEDALTGRRTVDVDRIEVIERSALDECLAHPAMPASRAFGDALRRGHW